MLYIPFKANLIYLWRPKSEFGTSVRCSSARRSGGRLLAMTEEEEFIPKRQEKDIISPLTPEREHPNPC